MGGDGAVSAGSDHPRRDIVVVGASAGGVQALRVLLARLPADFAAAVFVVLHLPEGTKSQLDAVLSRASTLSVATAQDGDEVRPGRVLVAPSGRHLLLRGSRVQVRQGPRENGVRPSVDVLFRSAALTYGSRVISVVLTGLLDDGAAGAREVLRCGGVAVVEDPFTAEYASMPRHAIEAAPTALVAELALLADLLVGLVEDGSPPDGRPAHDDTGHDTDDDTGDDNGDDTDDEGTRRPHSALPADVTLALEIAISAGDAPATAAKPPGRSSGYTCPDCGGVLKESDSRGEGQRYRCRVGHGWSGAALLQAKDDQIEAAMWSTIHLLEERAELCLRLADRAERSARPASGRNLRLRAEEANHRVAVLRGTLLMDP